MNITHKRALHDYHILESTEAGIQLSGAEVKSVKGGRISLEGSFVRVIDGELFLVNAQIFPYPFARPEGYDARRSRRLLLHKREILSLTHKMEGGALTLVPLECYNKGGFIKLKIGLAKGAKEFEKREKLKRRDIDRDTERELRGRK